MLRIFFYLLFFLSQIDTSMYQYQIFHLHTKCKRGNVCTFDRKCVYHLYTSMSIQSPDGCLSISEQMSKSKFDRLHPLWIISSVIRELIVREYNQYLNYKLRNFFWSAHNFSSNESFYPGYRKWTAYALVTYHLLSFIIFLSYHVRTGSLLPMPIRSVSHTKSDKVLPDYIAPTSK